MRKQANNLIIAILKKKGRIQMKEDRFIKEVAKKLKNGMCDLFVGSGISAPSKLPTWSDFLTPFLDDLDIQIKDGDDLPLLAQYVVNHNAGNRNIIAQAICDTFGRDYPINNYHRILSSFPICTIWTTNYDKLLEKAFFDRRPRTIFSEETLLHPYEPQELEIIKLHGDAEFAAKGIVLTKDDYNNFLYDKPMLAQRLRETIINRSLLFIGYSYQDYNIQNIMVQASQMKKKITNPHFILLCKIEKRKGETVLEFKQRQKRFDLWVSELNRIGILELTVPKNEIENVLVRIEKATRDNTVYVTGKHDATAEEQKMANSIGEALAGLKNTILNCGQSTGIGNAAVKSFMDKILSDKQEINQRMRMFPNPYAISPDYANNPSLLPSLKAARIPLISSSKLIIAFQGGMGTETEIDIAFAKEKLVIPIILEESNYDNNVIKRIIYNERNMEEIKKLSIEYYMRIDKKEVPSFNEIISIISEAVNEQASSNNN